MAAAHFPFQGGCKMARFTFNTKIALMFNDANIAALFDNLCFWIAHNKVNHTGLNKIEIGGQIVERTFTFNSIQAFCELYPFWTKKQIETYLTKLRTSNLIVKATFNKKGFDRTSWYCLVDEGWLDEFIPSMADEKKEPEQAPSSPEEASDEKKEPEQVPSSPEEASIKKESPNLPFPQNGKSISPKREIHFPKTGNPFPQNGKPIPDITPDITPYINEDEKQTAATALKSIFEKISPELVFDEKFYPAAAAFLHKYELEEEYCLWIYRRTVEKKPDNLRGYYYSVFMLADNAKAFMASKKVGECGQKTAERKQIVCPVCGQRYDEALVDCPVCGFAYADRNNSRRIEHDRAIRNLPAVVQMKYQEELMKLYQISDFTEQSLIELDDRYGIQPLEIF